MAVYVNPFSPPNPLRTLSPPKSEIMNDATSTEPTRDSISAALDVVRAKLQAVHSASPWHSQQPPPRLVAVSKTKPAETVRWAFESGQRHFGENYVQELVEKSQDPAVASLDIRWHFIGHLQRNKCNNLASTPGLWMVETVDSDRLATALDNSWKKKQPERRLKIYLQVNTSGEHSKSGCRPDDVPRLVQHVQDKCTGLEFCGLMTIGRLGHDYSTGPNPDFEVLVRTKENLCRQLGLDAGLVELSMGMSADYEHAVAAGSGNVRVGSSIFGTRPAKH